MWLKFQVSRKTSLDPALITDKIGAKLKTEEYDIISRSENSITFKPGLSGFAFKNAGVRQLNWGKFETIVSAEGTVVKLKYESEIFASLTIACIIVIAFINSAEYLAAAIFAVIFAIAKRINFMITQAVAEELLIEALQKS
jgi:hypothetical protein